MSYYCTAPESKHGLMICAGCQKPISDGWYRAKDKGDRYVTHHRACCKDDPRWTALDAEAKARAEHAAAFSAACVAFSERWGVDDINDYILAPEEA